MIGLINISQEITYQLVLIALLFITAGFKLMIIDYFTILYPQLINFIFKITL